ncbi:MAG: Rrf2 family transcriptional regulator [Candidatus Omnitrophica bacterium]|nr:Rrf2 family transcriptional regulator [Candidatus Omnitrophota bacterium]
MISNKTKYGLHALMNLSEKYNKGPVLIADLAYEEKIPKKFLELILLELKNNGILQSKKGKGGGYQLARNPNEVKIGQIMRILDGPIAPVACVSQSAYKPCKECKDEHHCGIRLVMKDVRDAMSDILDNTSLADVAIRINNLKGERISSYQI